MKAIKIIAILAVLAAPALALGWGEEYTIEPKYYDFNQNDGIYDPGSRENPYVIRDRGGQTVGTIVPKNRYQPGGTRENPYVIEPNLGYRPMPRPDWKYGEPLH